MAQVTIDDLDFAMQWISHYDPAPDEQESGERVARITAWLQAEIVRRTEDAAIRQVMLRAGVSREAARRALVRVKSKPVAEIPPTAAHNTDPIASLHDLGVI